MRVLKRKTRRCVTVQQEKARQKGDSPMPLLRTRRRAVSVNSPETVAGSPDAVSVVPPPEAEGRLSIKQPFLSESARVHGAFEAPNTTVCALLGAIEMKSTPAHRVLFAAVALWLVSSFSAAAALYQDINSFPVPTAARALVYSPVANALILRNTASEIVAIDLATLTMTTRLANTQFTDMAISPSGRYIFAADYGGENIGYGTPLSTSYVHRLDLFDGTWDIRTAYIAFNIQAVSDTQVILKSIDQWVTFTNNGWGSGTALIPLNTPSGYWGPGYYPGVYFGDFRYDPRTARLIHGNSNLSSQEIQAFKIIDNEFVRQEGSGIYGSAQGYGGTLALATDGSSLYYGSLQVDALDVTHNLRVFPEDIYAATGDIAFGEGGYYDAHSGALLGALPFATTVYALNPSGDDFWAYDPSTSTVHHFARAGLSFYTLPPCRIFDTRQATGPSAAAPALAGGESRLLSISSRCGVPTSARSLVINVTVTAARAAGKASLLRGDLAFQSVGLDVDFRNGQTRANNGLLWLPPDGSATIRAVNSAVGQVDLIVDVSGFFQ